MKHSQRTNAATGLAAASGTSLGKAAILAGTILAGSGSMALAATCESMAKANLPQVTITSAQSTPAGSYQPPGSATT